MGRMQSLHGQCCCCATSVFSAILGILMVSTGVCLVLNYGLLEVDTSGLPPQWNNEEGKKVVGIILICVGLSAMGIGAIVSILYYTICSRPKPQVAAIETLSNSQINSTSSTTTRNKTKPKHKVVQELKNTARLSNSQNLAPPTATHSKRHKRKVYNYYSKLTTHREESSVSNLVVRYQNGETAIENNINNMSNDNYSTQDSSSSTNSPSDSDSTTTPSVIIRVNSLPPLTRLKGELETNDTPSSTVKNKSLEEDIANLVV